MQLQHFGRLEKGWTKFHVCVMFFCRFHIYFSRTCSSRATYLFTMVSIFLFVCLLIFRQIDILCKKLTPGDRLLSSSAGSGLIRSGLKTPALKTQSLMRLFSYATSMSGATYLVSLVSVYWYICTVSCLLACCLACGLQKF